MEAELWIPATGSMKLLGLLLLVLLLQRQEGSGSVGSAAFPNNLVASRSTRPRSRGVGEALLSGRGGKGERRSGAVKRSAALPLAGHGGLEEWSQDLLILDLGGGDSCRRSCSRWWVIRLHAIQAGHGGEEERYGEPTTFQAQHRRLLPAWCYVWFFFVELNHADGLLACAICCQHGGISSTSCVEALPPSGWSSAPGFHQVVRPRWFHGVQRRRSFVGFGSSSIRAQFLDDDVLRMSATGGGDAQGPDCVSTSAPGEGSVVVRMIHAVVLLPGLPAGGTGGVRAAGLALVLVAVLGFLASEDEDLHEFLGSFPKFDAAKTWLAHAVPKCKIFAWLALHAKLLTADMLAISGWMHYPVCPLCLSSHETADHMCKDCPFTAAIWTTIHQEDAQVPATHGQTFASLNAWWDYIIEGKSVSDRRRLSGRFLYVLWNAWKERNRRIFTCHCLTYIEVASIAREDIAQRNRAFTPARVTYPAEPD
ncbi:hypothetical protein QYE76_000934 [Lolium multiflorum]|uniref:Reverse transcriptase zinc-binding domain-containing protein n=1 Tax=Lolium multiflorum TaxID=4521 RepID=A0AAD8RKC1_LOLMU|nr:hypothetical protein QYE76_000934 [Lolium multiflorum]